MIIFNNCKISENFDNVNDFDLVKKSNSDLNIHIIPNSGCTGCITGMEENAIKKLNENN